MPKVIVTAANGRLGSAVVEQLVQVSPASLLAVSVRDPRAVQRWAELGVDIRHGDFDLPETLTPAFEGAERLLIISTSSPNDVRVRQHRNAIEAARRAGVRRLYYTSIVQREGSPFTPAEGHAQTEADLMQSGLAATILRNGQYMENLSLFLHLGLDGHRIALPADGPTAWVALRDLAEGNRLRADEGGRRFRGASSDAHAHRSRSARLFTDCRDSKQAAWPPDPEGRDWLR